MNSTGGLDIESCIRFLCPSAWETKRLPLPLDWPPDMFGIVASLLNLSGAYTRVIDVGAIVVDWPSARSNVWSEEMTRLGTRWKEVYAHIGGGIRYPREVAVWWKVVVSHGDLEICEIKHTPTVYRSLFNLLAICDEACAGIGFLDGGKASSATQSYSEFFFKAQASAMLDAYSATSYGTTLCEKIHPSRARVVPKLHTPTVGLTLRSLSLYIALSPADEIKTTWSHSLFWPKQAQVDERTQALHLSKSINMLLVPWPMTIYPSDFKVLPNGIDGDAHNPQRLFGYDPIEKKHKGYQVDELVDVLLERSASVVGPESIHCVVLPETAVTAGEYTRLKKVAANHGVVLICGVRDVEDGAGVNQVGIYLGSSDMDKDYLDLQQRKHHRWNLDSGQISTYGMVSTLHPDSLWWEGTKISDRTLRFVAFNDWLCLCALICEDLARQDPVAAMVRAIGPSLLISLLMDGPQLGQRWPARYATVLADDPGTSVLTLTSIGMVRLSHAMRPSGVFTSKRTVASWKDRQSGLIEIDLPQDEEGIILCLSNKFSKEKSADGRSDRRTENLLVLGGIHTLAVGTEKETIQPAARQGEVMEINAPSATKTPESSPQIPDDH